MAKVSIIVPVYNAEKYLKECLDSILNQTYKDIEVICVDDGSTDSSADILKDYEEKDNRVKIIKQQNLYAGVARNAGIEIATGEYLLFLDADDFFEPDMVQSMHDKMEQDEAEICLCNVRAYSDVKKKHIEASHYLRIDEIPEETPFAASDISENIFQITTPAPWNKMFRKQFIEENDISFDAIKRANDLYFTYLSMASANRITVVNEPFVNYRIDIASSLQGSNDNGTYEFIDALTHLQEELKKRKLWVTYEKSFTNRALSTCLFNLEKTKSEEAFIAIYDKLKNESFYKLGILGHSKGYFFIKSHFTKLSKIVVNTAQEAWEERTSDSEPLCAELIDIDTWKRPEIKADTYDIKVSVIIPIYNVEKFLEECIESVVNQTLEEIEIICVNDGSQDSSVDIVNRYQEKDSRVKLVNKENGGLSSARNAGIEVATGEYILFLDSDDYLDKQALEYLYYEAKKDNLDQLHYSASVFYDECDENTMAKDAYVRKNDYSSVMTGKKMFSMMVENWEFKPSACLQMSRLDFLKQHQLVFKEGIIHEDNLFTIQCLYWAERVRYANINLYQRRVRAGSITTDNQNFRHAHHFFIIIKELEKFALENNIKEDKEYFDALKKQSERIINQATEFIRTIDEEELEEYIKGIDEGSLDFYLQIYLVAQLRKHASNLAARANNAEENLRVQRYRYKLRNVEQTELRKELRREIKKLKKTNKKQEKLLENSKEQITLKKGLKALIRKVIK